MATDRRFDSEEYLAAWKLHGFWPRIHDAMVRMVERCATRREEPLRVLDLTCSTGLLGQRVSAIEKVEFVMGVDRDEKALAAGLAAGVNIPLERWSVVPGQLKAFVREVIVGHRINTIVARRCLPELFDRQMLFGAEWAREMRLAGVGDLLIEGRRRVARPVSVLHSVDQEIVMVGESYFPLHQDGEIAWMEARA